MFDGNHRSRRTVNLGGGAARHAQRQNNVRSKVTPTSSSLSSSFIIGSKPSSTTTTSVVEESKRQREIRRIIQLQNISVKKIQKVYIGYKTRQYVVSNMIQKPFNELLLEQQSENNSSIDSSLFLLPKITLLLNIGCRMLLDHPSCYNMMTNSTNNTAKKMISTFDDSTRNAAATTTTSSATMKTKTTIKNKTLQLLMLWMKQYHNVIMQAKQNSNPPMLISPLGIYHGHQIIRAVLYVIEEQHKQQHTNATESTTSSVMDVIILSYIMGISFDDTNMKVAEAVSADTSLSSSSSSSSSIYWKRLGGSRNFLALADYYRRQKTTLQQQYRSTNNHDDPRIQNKKLIFLQCMMKYAVPYTKTGRAFHGILEMLSVNPSQAKIASTSFSEWIIPIVSLIQSKYHADDDIDDTLFALPQDMDIEKTHIENENDEILLWQAVQKMLLESPILLLRNALVLYHQEMNQYSNNQDDESQRRYVITSAVVLLIHHILFSVSTTQSHDEKVIDEHRGLISMLASRVARGDDDVIRSYLKPSSQTTSSISTPVPFVKEEDGNNQNQVGDVDDDEDDEEDDDNDVGGNHQEEMMKCDQEDIETSLPDGKKHKVDTIMTLVEAKTNSIAAAATHPTMNTGLSVSETGPTTTATSSITSMIDILRNKGGVVRRNNNRISSNLTKYDLQTVTKLDRIYTKDVQYCIQVTDTILFRDNNNLSTKQMMIEVASEIANPDLIIQWGRTLLDNDRRSSKSQQQQSKGTKKSIQSPQVRAYLSIVAILLQFTTGLKARQHYTSPMITKLAFTQDYTILLWKYIVDTYQNLAAGDNKARTSSTTAIGFTTNGGSNTIGNQQQQSYRYHYSDYLALSIFCDLFAHILIVMKDNVFIRKYTGHESIINDDDNIDNRQIPIVAKDVIAHVRDILHELYWTKPVQVCDFHCILPFTTTAITSASSIHFVDPWTDAARARTLLSGTKLWNVLYERWNRLVFFQQPHYLIDIDTNQQEQHSKHDQKLKVSNVKQRHIMCEENQWWFPVMTSALASGGSNNRNLISSSSDRNHVSDASIRRNTRTLEDHDDDAMSIDSSGSDNSIDMVDSGVRTGLPVGDLTSTADAESEALADAFSDPKMARILSYIPQAVPFDKRVKLFDTLLKSDKRNTQVDDESAVHHAMLAMMQGDQDGENRLRNVNREQVEIRRDHLYDDSMKQLNSLGSGKLKRRVQVSFINQHGAHEAGIDGGGVFKEFIDDLITDAFAVKAPDTQSKESIGRTTNEDVSTSRSSIGNTHAPRLFTTTPLETLAINTNLFYTRKDMEELLPHYEFLGRVLGKAVYESILVEPQFCLPFLNQLLGKNNSIEDLKNYDPEYYRNLTKLLSLSDSELEGLGLTFELTYGGDENANFDSLDDSSSLATTRRMTKHQPRHNKTRTVELLPGGSNKFVTKENVIQYIYLVAHQKLNIETSLPTKAFLRGFRDLIPGTWIRLFSSPYELQRLISGDDTLKGIDIQSFRNCMLYSGGYHPSQEVIQWFWEIAEEMTAEQQHKLLKFMTSCSRQPLLGFGSLRPMPCIQQIRLPEEMFARSRREDIYKQVPLPTSSTCMNLLKLPNYRWKELMKEKLLAAIESGAGFELT